MKNEQIAHLWQLEIEHRNLLKIVAENEKYTAQARKQCDHKYPTDVSAVLNGECCICRATVKI